MRSKLLGLFVMLLMLTTAQAKTIRHYLRLSDTNLNATFWQTSAVNPQTGNVVCDAHGNNSAIAWVFSSGLDVSSYSKLVFRIAAGQGDEMQVRINDNSDNFWDFSHKSMNALPAGETELTLSLSTLTHNNGDGDMLALNLSNIKTVEIFHSSSGGCNYSIEDLYFEKEVDEDYQDYLLFGQYTYGTLRAEHGYVTTYWGNDNFGWQFDDGADWSAYKYLVVVPKMQWSSVENEGTDHPVTVNLYNKTTDGFGDKIELGWIADWNPRRARAFDLTSVEGLTQNSIGKLILVTEFGSLGTWGLSLAYLTNSLPNYCNYNSGSDAQTVADYYRVSTSKDSYGTICLPYNAAVCGAEVYDVVGVDSKDAPSTLYMEQVDGILEAGKAYVFRTNSILNVTAYRVGENEVGSPITGNLQGTFVGASVPEGCYILVNGQWKKVTSAYPKTVGANKAYLTLSNSLVVPAEARANYVAFNIDEGETTSIRSIGKVQIENENYFNLSGQRVDCLTKGLYVKNGKKVIIK